MSPSMERAFSAVAQLPEADQEAIAAIILQEIESDRRWDELFAQPESADLLSRMADVALAKTLFLGRGNPIEHPIFRQPVGGQRSAISTNDIPVHTSTSSLGG